MELKYLLKIFIIFLLILSVIIFINSIGLKIQDPSQPPKKLLQVATIEGFENPLLINSSQAFCSSNKGYELEKACNNLTDYNCNLTSCCIWANNKCKAGDAKGPLFNSDSNGKTIPLDHFYFQNKCYGKNCSNVNS